jgi:hypothetical protein
MSRRSRNFTAAPSEENERDGDDGDSAISPLAEIGVVLAVIGLGLALVGTRKLCANRPKTPFLLRAQTLWRCLTRPVLACLPALLKWCDLTTVEVVCSAAFFVIAGLPILLSGLANGASGTAKLSGTTATVAMAVLILPATRTSLWVRVLGLHYDRALLFHTMLATWALMSMVRARRFG